MTTDSPEWEIHLFGGSFFFSSVSYHNVRAFPAESCHHPFKTTVFACKRWKYDLFVLMGI
jgi:hypothetical protein